MRELRSGEGGSIEKYELVLINIKYMHYSFFKIKAYFNWRIPGCNFVGGRSYPARMAGFSG